MCLTKDANSGGIAMVKDGVLTINFGGLKAVNEIDCVIGDEVVGLIGPNGSGKTTL